jgi:hypothetical protein
MRRRWCSYAEKVLWPNDVVDSFYSSSTGLFFLNSLEGCCLRYVKFELN